MIQHLHCKIPSRKAETALPAFDWLPMYINLSHCLNKAMSHKLNLIVVHFLPRHCKVNATAVHKYSTHTVFLAIALYLIFNNVLTSLSVREEVNTSHSRERPAPAVTTVAQREEPVVPSRQEKGTCDRDKLDHSGGSLYPVQYTHNPTTACRVPCSSQQHNIQ